MHTIRWEEFSCGSNSGQRTKFSIHSLNGVSNSRHVRQIYSYYEDVQHGIRRFCCHHYEHAVAALTGNKRYLITLCKHEKITSEKKVQYGNKGKCFSHSQQTHFRMQFAFFFFLSSREIIFILYSFHLIVHRCRRYFFPLNSFIFDSFR